MKKIDVTVIMPSLNVCDYIEKAVRSVMEQTLENIEILCVDAGSTDGTLEILQALAKEDSRIQIINSQIKSYGYQLNLAISLAKGEYIGVVETDDYISKDMYRCLFDVAIAQNCDIVKGNYKSYFLQEGDLYFINRANVLNKMLYSKPLRPIDYTSLSISDWYLWSGIYRRNFLLDNKIKFSETPGAAFQDIGFINRTNIASQKSIYLEDYFYFYNIDRPDSSSNSGRGFEYCYNEYSSLLSESWEKAALSIIYARMCKLLSTMIKGITSEEVKNEKIAGYYKWFADKVQCAINEGIVSADNIPNKIWNQIFPVPSTVEEAFELKNSHINAVLDLCGQPGENEIIIFGCGSYGCMIWDYLSKLNYDIVAFSDNNEALWNTTLYNLPIISPQNIDAMSSNRRIIIANELYYMQIQQQLLEMGIPKEKIGVYH